MSADDNSLRKRAVVWVRCSDPAKFPALLSLDEELQQGDISIWLEMTLPQASRDALAHPTSQRSLKAFLKNLKPDVVLWVGGQLDPTTLSVCHLADIPVVVADAGIAMLPRIGRGWFPGKTRALLSQLRTVLARTEDAASGLVRAGVSENAIKVTGSLEENTNVLKWDEEVRYALAQQIGPRPIWFAGNADEAEAVQIANAHRQAALRAHRLLCIVTPFGNSAKIADQFRDAGLNTLLETDGAKIDESTQIFVADGAENHGLWTRLAPISFIGGSHTSGARLDPFHVATVGSAIIHGRNKGSYSTHFDRLMNANATFVCDSFDELGPAVAHLLSAEKAARQAQAGWDVTSSGAEVVNIIGETLRDLISDKRSGK